MTDQSTTPSAFRRKLQGWLRRLPVISLILSLLMSGVFWLWQWQDRERIQDATGWYTDSDLYALEVENYFSHLAQTRQAEKAQQLEEWHQQGKSAAVAMALVTDRDFAYYLATTTSDFWGGSVYPKWFALRQQLNDMTRHFSAFKWGLSGADKRPLTFFTHGFLNANAWQWGVCVLMLVISGVLVEARSGALSYLILFVGGTALTGLLGLIGHWNSATPLVGGDGGISTLLGASVFLGGLELHRWQFRVPAIGKTNKDAAKNDTSNQHAPNTRPSYLVTVPLYGAYWVILWLGWLVLARMVWQLPITPGLIGVALGIACGAWLKQRMQRPVIVAPPAPPSDEIFRQAYDKALTRLSGFDFRGAEDALSTLLDRYPQRGDVAERLFMLRHYRPHDESHFAWAESLLERLSHDAANLLNIEHITHALTSAENGRPLSAPLLDKLLINATQAGRHEFALWLAKAGIKQHCSSPLFIKGLRSLARRLRAVDEDAAMQLEQTANDLGHTATASS